MIVTNYMIYLLSALWYIKITVQILCGKYIIDSDPLTKIFQSKDESKENSHLIASNKVSSNKKYKKFKKYK